MTDSDDGDVLAAEYALGTLDHAERTAVAVRLGADPSLRRAVADWEARLGPLAEAAADVFAPDHIFPSLLTRLFASRALPPASDARDIVVLRARLRRWRAATTACAALAAALLLWIGVSGYTRPSQDLVAVLQKDAGTPAVVLAVDLRTRELLVRPIAATFPEGKTYELWIIEPKLGAPRSLGTVPSGRRVRASLSAYDSAVIENATYAITIEPSGGSPTGAPSGAPVLVGRLAPQ